MTYSVAFEFALFSRQFPGSVVETNGIGRQRRHARAYRGSASDIRGVGDHEIPITEDPPVGFATKQYGMPRTFGFDVKVKY